MKRICTLITLMSIIVLTMNALAAELPQRTIGNGGVFTGGSTDFTKTETDTLVLIGPWGSGAPVNGQFQDTSGDADWNAWTHWDETQPTITHWHASGYNAENLSGGLNNLAAFCGDATYEACDSTDPVGGYGNNWNDILEFSFTVSDKNTESTMEVSGVFNSNTEPGYDFVTFRFVTADGFVEADVFDGVQEARSFSFSLLFESADYVGDNNDEVRFQVQVESDGGWSDEDCDYWSNGACQVDDLRVQCSNGDCDVFTDFQDGTLGQWYYTFPRGVGDFSAIWSNLVGLDPCIENSSPQVAFIDDGIVVPGVGPSYCINWCYGPNGFIVNTTGGALPGGHLSNLVESPVISWPGDEYTGAGFAFDVYQHEDLSADAPGIFYTWNVRSTADEVNHPIATQSWNNRHFVYYGPEQYLREDLVISDLLVPGATHVQVQLQCQELGWLWGWGGNDGYPAPYFDNVRLTAFATLGPKMIVREINLAQDNFKELEEPVDLDDLASNYVRFDAALSTAIGGDSHNTPGDSLTASIYPARVGAEIISTRLVYSMDRNPVFDSVRDPDWGSSGFSPGTKNELTSRYFFDLPDSSFLFPGDVLHYYIEATDAVGHTEALTSTLPADTTGFGNFTHPTAYNRSFQMHALPSVNQWGDQPTVLFWNDNASRSGEDLWFDALDQLGLGMGHDYDVYYTNGPSSGVGNGLGGRAAPGNIDGYTDLLYTCGDLGVNTISNGDPNMDPGNDTALLLEWFDSGVGRDAFLCGDNLASDMSSSGPLNSNFLADIMNVEVLTNSIRQFIHNQTTPVVLPEASNSVFPTSSSWITYGGCFGINSFDGILAGDGAERLARFSNPAGIADYDFSAATLNMREDDSIITMPYDFMYIQTDPNNKAGREMDARVYVLRDILSWFDVHTVIPPSGVPGLVKFSASSYPNPFNPATRISYTMPKQGHLTLKVYNVRGELVKTLIDGIRTAGPGHIMWDGTTSQDAQVSSGVYFYEARTGGEVVINKMALVK